MSKYTPAAVSFLFFTLLITITILLTVSGTDGKAAVKSSSTTCSRWQGRWWQKFQAVRCVKDSGAPANNIVVTHNAPCDSNSGYSALPGSSSNSCVIKYSVGLWTGACDALEGRNRLFTNQYLRKGSSQTYFFDAAAPGICKELYVFECTKDGRPYDCYYAVKVTVN